MSVFQYQGGNAFDELDRCAGELANLVFDAREQRPDATVELSQADSHALIDAMHLAYTVGTVGLTAPKDGDAHVEQSNER